MEVLEKTIPLLFVFTPPPPPSLTFTYYVINQRGEGGSGLHDVCMTELIWDTVYKGKPIVGEGSELHDDFA